MGSWKETGWNGIVKTVQKKTNCATCGQTLPKRVPQSRDIVQFDGLLGPKLGVVVDDSVNAVLTARYAAPLSGYVRVIPLNGSLTGLTTQWPVDRLTVVHGHFHVTERL